MSERVFLEFRDSKSPYQFCRYLLGKNRLKNNLLDTNLVKSKNLSLLETSKDSYVLFQAVSTLQEATLREWTLLTSDLRADLQRFLLSYSIQAVSSPQHAIDKFVLKQILQTLAVFYKRAKLDAAKQPNQTAQASTGNDPLSPSFIKDVIELFKSSDIKLVSFLISIKFMDDLVYAFFWYFKEKNVLFAYEFVSS